MTMPPDDHPQVEQFPSELAAADATERSESEGSPIDPHENAALEEPSPAPLSPQGSWPSELPLFANVFVPDVRPPVRIPHLGHVALLGVYFIFGSIASAAYLGILVYFHVFHISGFQAAVSDIRGALGSEAILYLVMLAAAYFTFPHIWHKGFFAGVQWEGATALRLRWQLIGTGFVCFVLAILNMIFIPGPSNAPIEKIFKEPGAAWFLFFFGITFAPFFEEMFFRGFLLPALCTAYDWLAERLFNVPRRPLSADGHPQWSFTAMVIGSVATSAPFALMHAEQTGNSVDAVLLLACISLVLCAIRLITRSLASSVFVHAFYNFLLFSIMLLSTQGFQHLDKM